MRQLLSSSDATVPHTHCREMAEDFRDREGMSGRARLSHLLNASSVIRKHRQWSRKSGFAEPREHSATGEGQGQVQIEAAIAACDEGVQKLQRLISLHTEKAAWSSVVQEQSILELREKEAERRDMQRRLREVEGRHERQLHLLGRERKDLVDICDELYRHLEHVPRFQPLLRKLNLAAKIKKLKDTARKPMRNASSSHSALPCTARPDTVVSSIYREKERALCDDEHTASAMPWETPAEGREEPSGQSDPVDAIHDDNAKSCSRSGTVAGVACESVVEDRLVQAEQELANSQAHVLDLEASLRLKQSELQQERLAFDRLLQTYQHLEFLSSSRVKRSINTTRSPAQGHKHKHKYPGASAL